MTQKICVSIIPKTTEEALRLIELAEKASADLVEVRLDGLRDHADLTDLAKHGNIQKIATNRLVSSLGGYEGTEKEQKRILLSAAKKGFEYVDIEHSASNLKEFTTEVSENGAKPIVSFHKNCCNFAGLYLWSQFKRYDRCAFENLSYWRKNG